MVETIQHRLILRADLVHARRNITAHTVELSVANVLVCTDERAHKGDSVRVRLSFPGLVEPLDLESEVASKRVASAPGDEAAWLLRFLFRSKSEQSALQALLSRGAAGQGANSAVTNKPLFQVLFVDDSRMTRDAFRYSMEKYFGDNSGKSANFTVDVAEDGRSAWDMLGAGSYDLAIVDCFLPDMNGDEVIRRMRRDPHLGQLPILAVSVDGVDARDKMLAAGADMFVAKPLVLRDLLLTLNRLTSRTCA